MTYKYKTVHKFIEFNPMLSTGLARDSMCSICSTNATLRYIVLRIMNVVEIYSVTAEFNPVQNRP